MPNPKHNPNVDGYLDEAEAFAKPILAHLRELIHATCPGVTEEMKWGIPHFDYRGEMMCIFAAYKKHCSFSFWKDSLMGDVRLNANSALPAAKRFMGKLTTVADLPPDSELTDWIKEAMVLNEQGVKLPPRKSEGLVPCVAGQLDERVVDEHDRIVRLARVGDHHRHASRTDRGREWVTFAGGCMQPIGQSPVIAVAHSALPRSWEPKTLHPNGSTGPTFPPAPSSIWRRRDRPRSTGQDTHPPAPHRNAA